MGEIVNFPNTDHPIFELDPTRDASWDMIIDEALLSGICLFQCEGKMYQLKIEDLEAHEGQNSIEDSQDNPA